MNGNIFTELNPARRKYIPIPDISNEDFAASSSSFKENKNDQTNSNIKSSSFRKSVNIIGRTLQSLTLFSKNQCSESDDIERKANANKDAVEVTYPITLCDYENLKRSQTNNNNENENEEIFDPSFMAPSSCEQLIDKNRSTLKFYSLVSAGLSFFVLMGLLGQIIYSRYYISLQASLSRQTAFKPVSHPDPPTALWGAVTKPYPTGAFWTNLVVRQGDSPIAVLPYGIKTVESGVQVSYGATRRSVTQLAISDPFVADLQISATQGYVMRSVESYDNISVTMAYKTNLNGKFKTYLVKGSPYVTFIYENATPMISAPLMHILAVESRVVKGSTGVQYIITLGNFQKWFVYCSEPMALTWKDDALMSPLPIVKGVVRVAILPIQNVEGAFNILMNYVQRYPTGGSVSITHPSNSVSQVVYQFNSLGVGSLLMLALPHHIGAMTCTACTGNGIGSNPSVAPVTTPTTTTQPNPSSSSYTNNGGASQYNSFLFTNETKAAQQFYNPIYCIKGRLKAVVMTDGVWKLYYNLAPVGWNYQVSEAISLAKLDEIGKSLQQDVNKILPNAADIYSFGKQIARMARLVCIADTLGISDVRSQALALTESSLTPWLQGTNQDMLLYDRIYGGVVTQNGINDPMADYGNGYYSDHHFHYGYIIYAAAVITRYDPSFYDNNKNMFDTIVRDICNPDPTDTDFPFARHKDFFDGHSWASGLFNQANGKGQESSSEAINAYYACYLYGVASNNIVLQQFSHTLLSMEIQATQLYWHMPNNEIYDGIFAASRMVGNIGGLDVTASTWFGSQLEYVHGINFMPLTPVTAALFDVYYVTRQWPVLGARLPVTAPTPPVAAPTATVSGPECSSRSSCTSLGLTGMCCPTPEGLTLACCNNNPTTPTNGNNGGMQDEWKSYIYDIHAIVNRDDAWQEILRMDNFGAGGSKSNSLYWVATRGAKLIDFDSTVVKVPDYAGAIRPFCNLNSACDAAGLLGKCCPSDNPPGVSLGCCPSVVMT